MARTGCGMTDGVDTRTSEFPPGSEKPVDVHHVLKERYLTLVESTLAGTIYEDAPLRASGVEKYSAELREYGWDWPSKAFTMVGLKRLRNFRALIESVIGTNVPGDIMEAGVWRGGAGIMARAVLAAYGVGNRRVILADSFAGLPPPSPDRYPADAGSIFHEYPDLVVPLDEVKRNFAKFGLLDEQVVFVPGLFKDSLPTAPVEQVAVLRLDCDMYESTIQVLDNFYEKVSTDGWIVIDDFEVVPACRAAVQDFLGSRNLTPELYPIDGVAVFFRKTEPCVRATQTVASQTSPSPRATRADRRIRSDRRSQPPDDSTRDQWLEPTPSLEPAPAVQPRAEDDRSSQSPVWLSDDTFRTKRFTFTMSADRFDGLTQDGTVVLLKDRRFVEIYRELTGKLRPQRILEIGFFQGGMPFFLADTLALERVVGLDHLQTSDALTSMIAGAGLDDTIKLYGGVEQGDLPTLRKIVEDEFADRPLDLIIDDASHEYENSRGCFQELFGYLRPGGKYIIEDWGWLHWPGENWQTAKSHFWGQPATTNLVFEVIMTLGSASPKIIAKIEILDRSCLVVTRGDGLGYRERVDLAETRLTCGRTFHPL